MQLNFQNKTAVVTGAASGLGLEIASLLLQAGGRVIGFDIVPVANGHVEGHVVNIGDPTSIDAALTALDGPVDALFNVAGLPQTKPAVDVLRVNVLGLRHLTDSLAPSMAAGSAVVNIASIAGNGWSGRAGVLNELLDTTDFAAGLAWTEAHVADQGDPYVFSKEAVLLYTKRRSHTLYKDYGVRMNCVSPGVMQTPMIADFRQASGDKAIDGVALGSTIGRVASPAEVAPSAVFLASDLAAFCSGTNLIVDGGWSAARETNQVDFSVFA